MRTLSCWVTSSSVFLNRSTAAASSDIGHTIQWLAWLAGSKLEGSRPNPSGDNEKTTTVIIKANLKVSFYIFKFFPHCSLSCYVLPTSTTSSCYSRRSSGHVPHPWFIPCTVVVSSTSFPFSSEDLNQEKALHTIMPGKPQTTTRRRLDDGEEVKEQEEGLCEAKWNGSHNKTLMTPSHMQILCHGMNGRTG